MESSPTVLQLPKSSGVKQRSMQTRAVSRVKHIRDYFYGIGENLMPHRQTSPSSDLKIFR